MHKQFDSIEEVIADESFLAWYFKTDESKAQAWEDFLLQNPGYTALASESVAWMNEHYIAEKELAPEQVDMAHERLQSFLGGAKLVSMKARPRRWWIPAAAVAVLLLVAGLFFINKGDRKTTLDSAYGAISEYNLPDGSHVTLNANSKITISKEWEKGTDREVWLQGEAFFKVQKTPMKNKFIVHTTTMDIIVTGTQFNAICRNDESSVLLTEGSVTIKTPDGKEIHMKPGDYVKLENNTPARQPVDQEKVLAWKQSKLDFENTSISEVARIIARHYGIKVTIANKSVESKTISGMMPNDNLDVLIQALEATGEYRITKTKDEIVISGQ